MRCIFCKQESTNSKSVEHIIPESLGGGDTLLLRAGIVCDKCNNYFSREVEKPFLDYDSIRLLRFEEGIVSKKGRIPTIYGVLVDSSGLSPISMEKVREHANGEDFVNTFISGINQDASPKQSGKLIFPAFYMDVIPNGKVLSRFLAKIALEYLALKVSDNDVFLDEIVDNKQLDAIREHARLGKINNWTYSIRTIYDRDSLWLNESTGEFEQVMNELDILITDGSEYYLVMALFGIEFIINLGGAEIEGYKEWLRENNNRSPLYRQKHAI